MAGRKTKYTPETVNKITDAVREGLPFETAAALASISSFTFYDWKAQKPEFSEAIEKARSEFEQQAITRIKAAGVHRRVLKNKRGEPITDEKGNIRLDSTVEGAWQADAWILERIMPEKYGNRMIFKINPDDAALLQKYGLKASDAWAMLMQQLAENKNE
jgi:hypothetical protein